MNHDAQCERDYYRLHLHGADVADICRCRERALALEVQRLKSEQYYDLLDQMDENWGNAREIGRSEINAFLESRAVHRPTTTLRERLAALEASLILANKEIDKLAPTVLALEEAQVALEAERDKWKDRYIASAKVRDQLGEEKAALAADLSAYATENAVLKEKAEDDGVAIDTYIRVHLKQKERIAALEAIVARVARLRLEDSYAGGLNGILPGDYYQATFSSDEDIADLPAQAQEEMKK